VKRAIVSRNTFREKGGTLSAAGLTMWSRPVVELTLECGHSKFYRGGNASRAPSGESTVCRTCTLAEDARKRFAQRQVAASESGGAS